MRFFNKPGTTEAPAIADPTAAAAETGPEKTLGPEEQNRAMAAAADGNSSDQETLSPDAQEGVRDIEAMTKVWSRSHLAAAYVLIWLIYFINSMQQGTTNALSVFVTSWFGQTSLTPATSVMSSLIGGLFKLPLAKIIDLWGRPQGYFLMVVFMTVGLIMMAACKNIETYAAAQVFYWVGYAYLFPPPFSRYLSSPLD